MMARGPTPKNGATSGRSPEAAPDKSISDSAYQDTGGLVGASASREREIDARLDSAAVLLSGARAGRIDSAVAEYGALALIDRALREIAIQREEETLARSRWAA